MWKGPASILCLAALPLIGCAGNYAAHQTETVTPAPAVENASYYVPPPRVYAAGPTAPAAVLVFLPGAGVAVGEPALWTAQGFDVVMPPAADIYRLVADQEAAMARLIASAEAMANAPVWLVGPSPLIEAALSAVPQPGRGRVSGVVVTSAASPVFTCSESFSYYDPGTGAPPRVQVRRSGNCGPGQSGISARQPSLIERLVPMRPNRPRIIEASAASKDLSPAARVKHLAELIKAAPQG
jgi:hypothetical protein